ncbi:hypothetical protein LZ496_05595 [Sphingomonas sp. NSE70-1]|uniref:Methyltransferase domain-containing protein n=1 Tax=Sphingomonas caseinilyticus TaxID=2908205 RepID=A0ABT0RTC8_9SPHN|nr:hypothetical protein [Sphingomonas caseinilyticus]MCL6698255.1 hypothetical protein [Sphingomonas caseinilyticus]
MSSTKDPGRIAVSFIVDADPVFAYTGWHLAHSVVEHLGLPWDDIHVQFTPEVPDQTLDEFRHLGCSAHRLSRFGDGRYCNKLAQWENLRNAPGDHFVFLDTDMICVSDFSTLLSPTAISAKIVDLENPKLPLLQELFERAGFRDHPPIVAIEAREGATFQGNCNGGHYSVPRQFADELFGEWRRFAQLLLDDIEPLRIAGKQSHVDQISFCMALHATGFPFEPLASNANYFLHFVGEHAERNVDHPLALLHYHNSSLNVVGLLEPKGVVTAEESEAVSRANDQIKANFNPTLFWEFRYRHFPERGSGVGSRGANLEYKRTLLRGEGIKDASTVLDVGCGDLEVVSGLNLKAYLGLDTSVESLERAARLRPEWRFALVPPAVTDRAEFVICFEVAIHQETAEDYLALIDFLAQSTERTLIVSGYEAPTEAIAANHMLYFHEALSESLARTGRFSSIKKVGAHTDVTVFRCDVGQIHSGTTALS